MKNFSLPDPIMLGDPRRISPLSLTVPETAPPDPNTIDLGFVSDRYFKCADGTIIDLKTNKIYRQANQSKDRVIRLDTSRDAAWDSVDNQLKKIGMELDALSNNERSMQTDYDKKTKVENKKLLDNLTDEQKQMLKELETGSFFKPSSLELEN